MSFLLVAAAAAAQVPLTVPALTVDKCGAPIRLEAEVTEISPDTVVAEYEYPAASLPVILDDRTSSAMAVSVPTVAYDQPLVLRNIRTGQIVEYPEIVEHRRPESVVTEIRTDSGFISTVTDAYIVTDNGSTGEPDC